MFFATKEEIRKNYIEGTSNAAGKNLISGKLRKTFDNIDLSKASFPPNIYYHITRQLIEEASTEKCKLSDEFKNGLAESLAIRIWNNSNQLHTNDRELSNPNWAEYHVGDMLVNAIGEEETLICAFKNPDLLSELLESIDYQGENLLDYLNKHIHEARIRHLYRAEDGAFSSNYETANCGIAIVDSSDYLQLPKKRRIKVLEKVKQKLLNLSHERER